MELALEGASEFVCTGSSTDWALLTGTVGCSAPLCAARIAASILARTLRALRVRATNGRSTLAPVVRMRHPAVGPSASSANTHARPTPPKIAPVVESSHCQNAIL